jgi:hypothetical protein
MKTFEEIVNQEPVFLDDFDSKESVMDNFCVDENLRDGISILFASYYQPPYEGYAYVLFEYDGKLYETYGSHCSCYGLEGQFDFNEVTLEELEAILINDRFAGYADKNELKKFLGIE